MLTQANDLPVGAVLTKKGGMFEIPETHRSGGVLVIESGGEGSKECWILATESFWQSVFFIQVVERVKKSGWKIAKVDKINPGLLRQVYEKSDSDEEGTNLSDSQIIANFDEILAVALSESVSDIHFEKRADSATIKMRKHGEMLWYSEISPLFATDLCGVLYNVLAETKDVVFNELEIQQAAIKRTVNGIECKLRYQSIPVYPDGFDVVLRVLPISGKAEEYTPLDDLGYEPSQVKMIMQIASKAVGALIIAGVTGSGKSTTLKNLLLHVHKSRDYSEKIYTVEDPPEYLIKGVSQIPVVRRKDDMQRGRNPFEEAVKACMRADPDVLMVGEIRDNVTGDLLKKAVQSGHRVLTTVHAASALGIIERLSDFGLSNQTLGSQEFIAGLMYQRLLATLCSHCSKPLVDIVNSEGSSAADAALLRRIEKILPENKPHNVRMRGDGCDHCNGTGITGRTVCAEVIIPDIEMLKSFKQGDMIGALKHLRDASDGDVTSSNMVGKSAMNHAIVKMLRGEVAPDELERGFGIITTQEITGLQTIDSNDFSDFTDVVSK